jgi:nucleoside-diphosphate-sugar epimerase
LGGVVGTSISHDLTMPQGPPARERGATRSYYVGLAEDLSIAFGIVYIVFEPPAPKDDMSLEKIALVGANGRLGAPILDALISAGTFEVSVIKRSGSSSKPAHADVITQITVPDDLPLDALTDALRSQQAVIAAFSLRDVSQHLRLVEAAARAGIERFIPADFGSCDAAAESSRRYLKVYRDKVLVRERCVAHARDTQGFSWTALVNGHFFDLGLRDGLLHTNLDTHTVQILDGGQVPASTSTLRRIAEAAVAVLRNPAPTRNQTLYLQSFAPTQREVVAALEKATGRAWQQEPIDSAAWVERHRAAAAAGDPRAIEEIVFVLGTLEADWRGRDGFAMDLLGLKDENLDDVVARVVAEHVDATSMTCKS